MTAEYRTERKIFLHMIESNGHFGRFGGIVGISWTEEDGQIPHKSGHEFHVSSTRRI